jgi:hypothetical protein
MSKYLVDSPQANDFLDLAQIESGLHAMLGDPEKYDPAIRSSIQLGQGALRDGAKKVAALVSDPTRTDVDKHGAAKKLAEGVAKKLTEVKGSLQSRADTLRKEAVRQADDVFGPNQDRAALHSEVRGWMREMLSKGGDGLSKVRAAMKGSDDLAAVLWHSPSFLLALPPEVHEELRLEALEARKPDLYASLSSSLALETLTSKYDNALRKVQASFYNPVVAAKAAKRVEV